VLRGAPGGVKTGDAAADDEEPSGETIH
jgi:hypothetical protein